MDIVTTKQHKEAVAAALNETPSLVSTMAVNWEKYLQRGVHGDVSISRFRGNQTVPWSDLGLVLDSETEDEMNQLFSVNRTILPISIEKALRKTEAAIRKNIVDSSIKIFGSNGSKGVNFIPVTKYQEMKEKHLELEGSFYQIRDEICGTEEGYAELKGQIERSLNVAAAQVYANLLKINPETLRATPEEINNDCGMTLTMPTETMWIKTIACFCEEYVGKAAASLPSREKLFESFSVNLSLEAIPTPSMFEADRLVAAQIRAQTDEVREQARLVTLNREESLRNARAIRENRLAAASAIRRQQVTKAELHEEALQEMNRDALRQLKHKTSAQVNKLVEELVAGLCEPLYERLEDIILKIDERGEMNNRLVDSARKALAKAEDIADFLDTRVGDELVQMMDHIRQTIGPDSKERNVKDVRERLMDFALVVREEMRQANCSPRLNLALPDMPDIGQVEAAKGRLGIRTMVNALNLDLDI